MEEQDRAGHVQYQKYHRTALGTYSIKCITGQRWARTVSKVSQDSAGHVQYQKYHRTALGTYSIKSITGQRWARTVSKVSQDSAGHVQYQKSASAHDTDTHAQTGISYSHRAKVCQRVKSRSFYEIFVFRA